MKQQPITIDEMARQVGIEADRAEATIDAWQRAGEPVRVEDRRRANVLRAAELKLARSAAYQER